MRISQKLKGLLVIVSAVAITGCTVMVRQPGPPAPGYGSAYGYYDDYYYYPSARVYFHIYTGYYYYLSGNRWVRSRVLPRYIRLYSADRHRLTIKDRYPYLRDYEIRKKYRPRSNLRFNERNDIRERELNTRRYQEYRQRGNGRSDEQYRNNRTPDRYEDRHDPRQELLRPDNRSNEDRHDPRQELLRPDNRSNQGTRPEQRKPEYRQDQTRDRDQRREDKRMQLNKKREDKKREGKSDKKSDSEDKNDDKNDDKKRDPRSTLFR
jgi:hypothetical protein